MEKPKLKTMKYLDYHECANYIGYKLGYDLRNTLGKTYGTGTTTDNLDYRDFWHFLYDNVEAHNGSFIFIPGEDFAKEEWQKEIIRKFHSEFGTDQDYWVSW